MSLLGKLMDTMRLNPDEEEDDYYLDDDFEEEAPRKGLFSKKNTEYDEEEEQDKPGFRKIQSQSSTYETQHGSDDD